MAITNTVHIYAMTTMNLCIAHQFYRFLSPTGWLNLANTIKYAEGGDVRALVITNDMASCTRDNQWYGVNRYRGPIKNIE